MAKTPATPAGLPPAALARRCDPAQLGFTTTDEVEQLDQMIGQDRAMDAIRLAAGMEHRDFNLYVLGPTGTGRRRAVQALMSERAQALPVPDEWVYVNNFSAPHKPRALRLPPGTAVRLRKAMQDLVDDLAVEIPAMFESDEYHTQRRTLEEEYGQRHETAMSEFAERAKTKDIALLRTPNGFMLAATRDGEVIKTEVYNTLDPAEQKKIDDNIVELQEDLSVILREAPRIERELRRRFEALHADMAERVVSGRVSEVSGAFKGFDQVQTYLADVRTDIISNAALFLERAARTGDGPFPESVHKAHTEPTFHRYAVNVMVLQGEDDDAGAPLVSEDLPTLDRLIGRIDHTAQMGTLVTNFTMIKPGALHRANGGFLVLDARRVLTEPMAWDMLKQCLKTRSVPITSMAERLSLMSTMSLEPDPIPLNVRVVLIGDQMLHALLMQLDPDFSDLFKLQADFEHMTERDDDTHQSFARIIATLAKRDGIRPLSAESVARLLDEASRLADDSRKLTLNFEALSDLLREADFYADATGTDRIGAEHIDRAVIEQDRRAGRIRDRLQEAVERGTILIDTEGGAVGQVNGLAVASIGGRSFGHASRITARVRMGTGKLVDIEREVDLGGPLHSKGVLILAGYLTSAYALDVPFSLHASLVFEQNYGGVDGDSASSTELFALLSALSGLPIDQGLAVTGSVNQAGRIQAIGGVNEKIEGFFETCRRRNLTGHQGVLIPASNVDHLMLRAPVVEAVAEGRFRVIPVTTIDEGIAILTGHEAGVRGADGAYPPDSVNGLVEARLREFAELRRAWGRARTDEPGKTAP